MTTIFERTARAPDRVLRYAAGECGVIDVYEPEHGAANELVMLVHGGFWRSRYDRRHLRPLAEALASAGKLVALPEYRRTGDEGGGWPGTFDDVCTLTSSVGDLLDSPDARLTLIGHSAGGHLAVLAAGAAPCVDRVISLAGVLDLGAAIRDDLSNGAARELLGSDLSLTPEADPMARPLPLCGIVLLHGDADEQVPVSYSEAFAARDARITFHRLRCGHYELIDPSTPQFQTVLTALG